MSMAAELWHFSLAVYARPGVAEHCLKFQDRWDAKVNIILWLAWLEQRALQVNGDTIAEAEAKIAAWHSDVTIPLRQLRRHVGLKSAVDENLFGETYRQLKTAELNAEQVEQRLLADLIRDTRVVSTAHPIMRGANLGIYLDGLQIPRSEQQSFLELL